MNYSKKLTNELDKNYSARLLYRMLKLYNCVSSGKLPTLSAKLSWSHYNEILRFDDFNKIDYYINIAINQNLRKSNQDKTIGIIICKQDNKYVIEYCSDNRIITREYELVSIN